MTRILSEWRLLVLALGLAGCKEISGLLPGPQKVCAGVGYNALRVIITDQLGRPQATGAAVHIFNGAHEEVDSGGDSLSISGAEEGRGFTYDIQVTKRYYQDAWVRGVSVPAGGWCPPPITVDVPVQITLLPDAPPVRSIHVSPPWALLDRPPYQSSVTYRIVMDADPGVSQAVTWSVIGDTASAAFDQATGTFTYRCLPKSGYMTVTATSVVDTTVSGTASLAVQGHPAATNDPPCT